MKSDKNLLWDELNVLKKEVVCPRTNTTLMITDSKDR